MRARSQTGRAAASGQAWIEPVLLMVTLTTILVALTVGVQRGMHAFREQRADRALSHELHRSLAELWSELAVSDLHALMRSMEAADAVATWQGTLELQSALDPVSGRRITTRSLKLRHGGGEQDNALDDDGDGLADECELVLFERDAAGQPSQRILVQGLSEYLEGELPNGQDDNGNGLVDERGLCLVASQGLVHLRLTLQSIDARGRLRLRTGRMDLGPRN